MLEILSPDGSLVGEPPISAAEARPLYAAMVAARTYDHKSTALQKQGRLATYASFEGQEAAQIGTVAALRADDWVVGTYRDAAAMWMQGYPWVNLFLGRTGDERGGSPPAGVNVLPPSITVGAHMIHAVGLGWAERHRGSDRIAMTLFGDGATSEGDFHEAMNFAAVFRAPVVFVCQNNQYAISTPRDRQTVSETLAQKADAYGMPGLQVDGNDLFAVLTAAGEAVARARTGEGPTLIEAVTFRVGAHTTADDPGRYRDPAEEAVWRDRDPIDRVRRFLELEQQWTPEWQAELEKESTEAIELAIAQAEELDPLEAGDMFDRMFATPTTQLERQRRMLLGEPHD